MKIAEIEINFSEPHGVLAQLPWVRMDPGAYVYRLYRDGKVHLAGSTQFQRHEKDRALERVLMVARRSGYTHWRVLGSAGEAQPL